MSRESTQNEAVDLHSKITDEICDMLVEFQDKSRSMQAKDAFWYAFEYAKIKTDDMNIQRAWEEYKFDRSDIS